MADLGAPDASIPSYRWPENLLDHPIAYPGHVHGRGTGPAGPGFIQKHHLYLSYFLAPGSSAKPWLGSSANGKSL
jgi:hypothetical protein